MALYGTVVILVAHGLSTGGLFIVVGILQERFRTRRMDALGGLWSSMPRLGGVALFLALASLGLPGLANFVGEFLVLAGTYVVSPALAALGALGFVLSSIYSLWLVYRVFQGPVPPQGPARDLRGREVIVLGFIIAGILWLGLYPQPVLNAVKPQVDSLVTSLVDSERPGVGPATREPPVDQSFGTKRDNR